MEPSPPPSQTVAPPQAWVPSPICHRSGWLSKKQFILPNSKVIPATEIAEYPFNIRLLANKLHITPGVSQHSLLSTGKFADANYITVFEKEMVNIYDANDTISPSAKVPSYVGSATWSSTSTKFRWLIWFKTTTPTPSLSIVPQQSFFLIDPHPTRQSTTFTN
jgi:hypothetical protein